MKRLVTLVLATLALGACGGSPGPAQHSYHLNGVPGVSAHSPTFGLPPKNAQLPALAPPTTTRTLSMDDSVVSSPSIFSGLHSQAVAGYTSGNWPTYWDYKGHFKYVVAIMVNTSHFGVHGAAASCLDVEPGDATPSEVGAWMQTEISRGFRPCAYGSLSEMPAIKGNIVAHGISLSKVLLWDADWTYVAHIDAGYAGTQWTNHLGGRNVDGSTISPTLVNAAPPKPAGPVCFGKNWQHTSFCNGVRAQDAALGKLIAKEQGFLKVTNANIAKTQTALKPLQTKIDAIAGRAALELKDRHWLQLRVSAQTAAPLAAKATPLEKKLTGEQQRLAVEQKKIATAQATLDASLKKYGFT